MKYSVKKAIDGLGRIVVPKNMRDYYGISLYGEVILIPTEKGILITRFDEKSDIAEESRTHTPCGEQFLRLSPNLVLQDRHLASTRFD